MNVWAGLIDDRLIGPVYLPDHLNANNYLEFLRDELSELLDEHFTRHRQEDIILMHDGAPAHFAHNVRNYLNQVRYNYIYFSGIQ